MYIIGEMDAKVVSHTRLRAILIFYDLKDTLFLRKTKRNLIKTSQ